MSASGAPSELSSFVCPKPVPSIICEFSETALLRNIVEILYDAAVDLF